MCPKCGNNVTVDSQAFSHGFESIGCHCITHETVLYDAREKLGTKCSQHPEEQIHLFCVQAQSMICNICARVHESGHKHIALPTAKEHFKGMLGKKMIEMQAVIESITEAEDKLSSLPSTEKIIEVFHQVQEEVMKIIESLKNEVLSSRMAIGESKLLPIHETND